MLHANSVMYSGKKIPTKKINEDIKKGLRNSNSLSPFCIVIIISQKKEATEAAPKREGNFTLIVWVEIEFYIQLR